MRFFLLISASAISLIAVAQKKITMNDSVLQDKIRGGWAGQMIGVTFGGPTEFRFAGTMINDYQPIPWYPGYVKKTMTDNPGLYDDLYMDLTFVEVFERLGLDAPVSAHANAYARAGYPLWHANQAGRYNILHGLLPPESGHWKNNPHADDIDFQIEADFSGLMSPGMPNTAVQIGDPIGHIMNYGDGWYGGAFIGAMYSLAFVSQDVGWVVTEGLKTIPVETTFSKCITDVIRWHKQYPADWKQTWFEIQKKWSDETGCPDGVFHAFNIDAKLNAAYVVLGLLYGNGDFRRTLEIATHAGQDSDCNPSSAGGILGTVLGYERIPQVWKDGLAGAEDINFKYTAISLNKVCDLSFKHALEVVTRNGGSHADNQTTILTQVPKPTRLELSFPALTPVMTVNVNADIQTEYSVTMNGTGMVIRGSAQPRAGSSWDYRGDYVFRAELYVDSVRTESAELPVNFTTRRHELFWNYNLGAGAHTITIKVLNSHQDYRLHLDDVLVYGSR